MHSRLRYHRAVLVTMLLIGAATTCAAEEDVFAVPEILKANVAFWKKVYTEIPLKGGLIHDRDYPMVIYETFTGTVSTEKVKARKEYFVSLLNSMAAQPESLWNESQRNMTELFKANASIEAFDGAVERVRFQQGQRERFLEGLARSGMYIDTIRSIMTQYGVPLRLAYLPHVESSFNTEAYSKVGAAGLWQFMRGTGKFYGMKIDYTIDERRDPIIATVAAARYLSSSYRELKTWPLAITSYNHGVGGMKRAVAQAGSNDLAVIIQKYSSRSFRFASANFYGCFLAASEIAENYKTYFPSATHYPRLHFADLKLDHHISPDVIGRFLNIPIEKLIDLNPAVRPAVFEQHKKLPSGFVIHIPSDLDTSELQLAIARIPDSLKSREAERPNYYRVNRGDNLYAIASRLGVTVKEIAQENNITRASRIRAGQVLRIPQRTPSAVAVAAAASSVPVVASAVSQVKQPVVAADSQKTDVTATAVVVTTSSASPPQAAAVSAGTAGSEAVAEIALAETRMNFAPEESAIDHGAGPIVQAASLPPAQPLELQPKKTVQKPAATSLQAQAQPALPVSPSSPPPPPPVKPQPKPEEIVDSLREIALAPALIEQESTSSQRPAISADFDVALYNLDISFSPVGNSAEIMVSVDETIGHYADWLRVPTARIRNLNEMGRTSDIRIGRRIVLPIEGADVLEKFVSARLEYHMAIEEDFYGQYKIGELKPRKIKRGESLWDICNEGEFVTPLWLFRKHNKQLDLGKLIPGTTVWIPVIIERTDSDEPLSEKLAAPSLYTPTNNPVRQYSPQEFQRLP